MKETEGGVARPLLLFGDRQYNMTELYVTINDRFFFQRLKLPRGFQGNARIHDFYGRRGMEINEDAFEIMDLLDSGNSVTRCIDALAKNYGIDKHNLEPVVQAVVEQGVKIGLMTIERSKPAVRKPVIPQCAQLPRDHFPQEVTLELTGNCNLRCKHCYGSFTPGHGDTLQTAQVLSALDQIKAFHCYDVRLTGGEPFLHPGIWEILDAAVNIHHFYITITTNGTLVTPQIARRLKEIGKMSVHISIDGHTPEINDAFRGVAGAFERAVAALKSLKEEGLGVRINHAVHQGSKDFIAKMWDFADELGIPILMGQVYRMGRCSETANDIHIEPSEFYRAITSVRHRYGERGSHGSNEGSSEGYIRRCDGGWNKIAIRPNGDITPCITYPHIPRFVMGNINEDSIEQIFYGFDRDAMLGCNNAMAIAGCKDCSDVSVCKSGCLAISFAETGRMDRRDSFSCARQRAVSGRPKEP